MDLLDSYAARGVVRRLLRGLPYTVVAEIGVLVFFETTDLGRFAAHPVAGAPDVLELLVGGIGIDRFVAAPE